MRRRPASSVSHLDLAARRDEDSNRRHADPLARGGRPGLARCTADGTNSLARACDNNSPASKPDALPVTDPDRKPDGNAHYSPYADAQPDSDQDADPGSHAHSDAESDAYPNGTDRHGP